MRSPYDPRSYADRYNIPRPKPRFSANERRKKQGDADFWSGVGAALPGIGGVAGGLIGMAGGPMGAAVGSGIGSALGSGIGSFATNHAQGQQQGLDEDQMQQDLLLAELLKFYGSGF